MKTNITGLARVHVVVSEATVKQRDVETWRHLVIKPRKYRHCRTAGSLSVVVAEVDVMERDSGQLWGRVGTDRQRAGV